MADSNGGVMTFPLSEQQRMYKPENSYLGILDLILLNYIYLF